MMSRAKYIALFTLIPLFSWAQETVDSDTTEAASVGLSKQLLCEVVAVGTSNIALMVGLLVALYGLWVMVRHASLKSGIILIISGALLTALPSLVLATMDGIAAWLKTAKISDQGDIQLIKAVVAQSGNCGAIPVDFSSYQNMPSTWAAFTGSSSDNPGSYASQMDPAAAEGGSIDPTAQRGTSGCINLVDGGGAGSPFGPRQSVRTNNGRYSSSVHKGVDITCQHRDGPAIHAASGGTAILLQSSSYGNRVIINHGGGKVTTYNHMSGYNSTVKNGASVGGGDVLGYCGHTGNVTGPHLHFEMKKNGVFVDPVANGCGG